MRTPVRHIRLDDERWEAFKQLLGNEWLRGQIDKAIRRRDRKPIGKPAE